MTSPTPSVPDSAAFTDSDVRRLKEDVAKGGWSPKMPALLARLEAAEKVCRTAEYVRASWINHHFGLTLSTEIDAWRKAAGKD